MPRVPPVTRAVLPAMENRSAELIMAPLWSGTSRGGQCDGAAQDDAGADPQRPSSTENVGLWCIPLVPSGWPPRRRSSSREGD
jgi:hypothetical protein